MGRYTQVIQLKAFSLCYIHKPNFWWAMTINSELAADRETLTIYPTGRFDFSCLQQFRASYEKFSPKPKHYIIDLKEADYLDSSALGMLLALKDFAGNDGTSFKIINCNTDVRKILAVTKLDELFEVI